MQGYLEHLTIERGVAANTLSSYRRDLRRYSKHLSERGIHDLAKVVEVDVSDFLVALRRGDPDSRRIRLVGGVGGAGTDRGAWLAPVRRGRRAGRTGRRARGASRRRRAAGCRKA